MARRESGNSKVLIGRACVGLAALQPLPAAAESVTVTQMIVIFGVATGALLGIDRRFHRRQSLQR